MKRRLALMLACGSGIIGSFFPAVASDAPMKRSKLVVAADAWCPVNCAPADGVEGFGIDLARRIFEPLGYQVEYRLMPWPRALAEVEAGTLDAVVGANLLDSSRLMFPRQPIYDMTDDFYVRSEDPILYRDIQSLRGKRIGIIQGYGYDSAVNELLADIQHMPGRVQPIGGKDALRLNIRKLLAGRIDVIIEGRPIMDYLLRKMRLEARVRHLGGVRQGNVYLAFSPMRKESASRCREFDVGMRRLASEGVLSSIYAVYGLQPPAWAKDADP